ncbi:MAG: type IV secretory system conjugative DNA transfer family protein [Acetobacteraceae bacterium]
MTNPFGRVLGMTFDNKVIREPTTNGSGLIFAAMGGGKTTCGTVPAVQAMLADTQQAIFLNDVKDGEVAAQIGDMCVKYGRRFGVVDEFEVLGANYPYRISLNPLSAALNAKPDHLPFLIDNFSHALIAEPPDDQKNFYWRDEPRGFADAATRIVLDHSPRLATPGGIASLLSDPETWQSALELEASDPDSPNRLAAARILDLKRFNAEHYAQHHRAAVSALRIFSHPPLSEAGRYATVTHEELIRDHWIVCFVNPLRYADRIGPSFALHYLSLMDAQLSGKAGRSMWILDEYCNAPLREPVTRITAFRAYGLRCLYITQSRLDSVRRYGERETAILEENCTVKQWLKFSNFEEAERVSRAMGESLNVSHGLGMNAEQSGYTGSLSTGRDRLFTPYELMSLPDDEQIIHVAGIGFIHARKIRQNEIAPTCFDLADNPLEGGRLPPNPKVTLPVPPRRKP